MSLSAPIKRKVVKLYTNAKALYAYLCSEYNVKSDVQSFDDLQTLISTRYEDCNGIEDYILKLTDGTEAVKKGLDEGEEFPNSMQVLFLLNGLGDALEVFITTYLDGRYKKGDSFSTVCQALVADEMRRKTSQATVNLLKT
jgi:hypothetical protein